MTYNTFITLVEEFAYGNEERFTGITMGMPFKDYNELLQDLLNNPSFMMLPSMDIIKHFRLNGVLVNIVEGDNVELGFGGPKESQKFFRTFKFQEHTKQAPVIQMQTLSHRA